MSDDSGGRVAILCPEGEDRAPYEAAITHGGGHPAVISHDRWDASAGGLLIIGETPFITVPPALLAALQAGVPVLGAAHGMHALNIALGGKPPVAVPEPDGKNGKRAVFISPGAKLSYTIAGSGWVAVPLSNLTGIRPAELAPGMMASCYGEDGFIAAFEKPGRNWVIGVQWDAHRIEALPKGFDSLLLALCERAEGE